MPMNRYEGQVLANAVLVLEECWLINSIVRNCTIFYSGGAYLMENTRFENCEWKFQNQAGSTHGLLKVLGFLRETDIATPCEEWPQAAELPN